VTRTRRATGIGRLFVLVCVLVFVLALPPSAAAWGLAAHRWVATRAAEIVRDRCPALVAGPRATLGDAAVEPDTVLKRRDGRRELARHYMNLDHYGPPPFRALPRDRDAALARYGQKTIERQGVLPWSGALLAARLRDEIRRGDLDTARISAGHLAHYVADATMPLHTTVNYDGKGTGQRGIHRRVEATLVDRDLGEYTRRSWKVATRRPIPPAGAAGALFAALEDAHGKLATMFAADRNASRGTKVGSAVYYRRLHADLLDPMAEQLGKAAVLTAALWEGACAEAGDRR